MAVLEDVKKTVFHEVTKKEPGDKQVLVKVDSCAICTLEQRVYLGVMNRYPFAGGHEAAGIVEAVGKKVTGVKPGDKVAVRLLNSCGECYYCRNGHENQCVKSFIAKTQECAVGPGGFSEYMMMEAADVYKMAEDIELSHAALSEPLACCVHSIENGKIQLTAQQRSSSQCPPGKAPATRSRRSTVRCARSMGSRKRIGRISVRYIAAAKVAILS